MTVTNAVDTPLPFAPSLLLFLASPTRCVADTLIHRDGTSEEVDGQYQVHGPRI